MRIIVCFCFHILSLTVDACTPIVEGTQEESDNKHLICKDQSEPKQSDNAIIQNNLGAICERMRRLDRILTPMYKDPPENGGEEVVRFSLDYEQACLDLLEFCKINKLEALKAAREMVESGGSKFLEVEINDDKMESSFKWGKGEMVDVAIEAGAEDCQQDEDEIEILCNMEDLHTVKEFMEKKLGEALSAKLIWKPNSLMSLDHERTRKVIKLLDALEDLDDVQNVWSNLDIPDDFDIDSVV